MSDVAVHSPDVPDLIDQAEHPDISDLIDQAEQVLALVESAEEAEVLWRKISAVEHAARLARAHAEMQLRAGRLKLRAERRWGELLGPAEVGRPPGNVTAGDNSTSRDRMARQRARLVAQVPANVFDRYLATVRDPERGGMTRVGRADGMTTGKPLRSSPASSRGGSAQEAPVGPPSTALEALWRARRAWELHCSFQLEFPLTGPDATSPGVRPT